MAMVPSVPCKAAENTREDHEPRTLFCREKPRVTFVYYKKTGWLNYTTVLVE